MRVAVQNWSARRVAGAETYIGHLLAALHTAGHEVAFWAESEGPEDRPPIPLPPGTRAWTAVGVEELRAWRPDVLVANGYLDPATEKAALAVAPAVLVAHNYYGTCISGSKCTTFPRPQPCQRRFGTACLAHYFPRRCGGLSPLRMWQSYRLQQARLKLLPSYQAVAVLSDHMRREYLRHGLSADRVVRISPQLASTDPGILEGPLAWPPDEYRLVMVGRCERLKGGDLLIQALPQIADKLHRPIQLRGLGDGPERGRWERLAVGLRTPVVRAEFAGWVSPERVTAVVRDSHLIVVPSVWPEPFGLVGLEAGRHGVPAAAFDAGGIRDWLHDGVNGRLAPANPPTREGLADAVVWCLADGERYRQLRAAARAVAERFSTADRSAVLEALLLTATRRD